MTKNELITIIKGFGRQLESFMKAFYEDMPFDSSILNKLYSHLEKLDETELYKIVGRMIGINCEIETIESSLPDDIVAISGISLYKLSCFRINYWIEEIINGKIESSWLSKNIMPAIYESKEMIK